MLGLSCFNAHEHWVTSRDYLEQLIESLARKISKLIFLVKLVALNLEIYRACYAH